MARLSGKTKETILNVLIIAVGMLLSFAVLMPICMIAFGGPIALVGLIVGMMGPPY